MTIIAADGDAIDPTNVASKEAKKRVHTFWFFACCPDVSQDFLSLRG